MSTTIDTVTIGGIEDRRLVLNNSQAARQISIGNSYTILRVAWRLAFDNLGSTPSSNPQFWLGLMSNPNSGLTNGPLNTTTSHFVGTRTTNTTWSLSNNNYNNLSSPSMAIFKRINTTETAGSTPSSPQFGYSRFPATIRSVVMMEFRKGTPWTVLWCNQQTASAADHAQATIKAQMEITDFATACSLIGGMGSVISSTLTIDEVTDGPLNAIVMAWNRSDFSCRISDVFWSKIS